MVTTKTPAVPVHDIRDVPDVAEGPKLMLEGLRPQLSPVAGDVDAASVTVLVKAFEPVAVIVATAEEPASAGAACPAAIEKSVT